MATGESFSPLWLGLDLSTQSLTLVLLPDEPGRPHVYLDSIVYATDLPQYQTEHGMHISDGDDGEKVRGVLSGGRWASQQGSVSDQTVGLLRRGTHNSVEAH